MQNSKSPVGTTDEKSTNVDAALGQPQLHKTDVSRSAFSVSNF